MSDRTNTLPAAIENVTTEESAWDVIDFCEVPMQCIEIGRVIVRNQPVYFERTLADHDDNLVKLPRLRAIKPRRIERDEALALRWQHDFQWNYRPRLRAALTWLWEQDALRESSTGMIAGWFDSISEAGPTYELTLDSDGSVTIRADWPRQPNLSPTSTLWREYTLRRGTSAAEHHVQIVGASEPTIKLAYNAKDIINNFAYSLNNIINSTELARPEE